MPTNTDTGGPAFPCASTLRPNGDDFTSSQPGMYLRDYFAGQVLSTCWGQACMLNNMCKLDDAQALKFAPSLAYSLADAMIAERNKTNNQ